MTATADPQLKQNLGGALTPEMSRGDPQLKQKRGATRGGSVLPEGAGFAFLVVD
mgnify:CR=1 FL=1